MASMIAAEAGKKGSEIASKALTGDIYTRKWATKPKRGKKQVGEVQHELKVNALTLAILGVGAGATATAAAFALWMTQRTLTVTKGKDMVRRVTWSPSKQSVTISTQSGVPLRMYKSSVAPTSGDALTTKEKANGYAIVKQIAVTANDDGGWTGTWQYHTDLKSTISTEQRDGFGIDIGL